MAAGCIAKHLMIDESFKKGWTRDTLSLCEGTGQVAWNTSADWETQAL